MALRGGRERSTSFRTIAVLMIIPVIGLTVFFAWNWVNGGETPRETWQEFEGAVQPAARTATNGPDEPPAAVTTIPQTSAGPAGRNEPAPAGPPGDIVLIIDDVGFEGQLLDRLMALDPNINCSVLPNGNRAREFATTLHEAGYEVLCHLPMQPRGNEQPGAGAILTPMADEEIAELTRRNIEAVPFARGVNNHMGSLATTDRRVMASVLAALPQGLFFIDSRTSGSSVAADVSRELRIPTAARDVFLDDVPARDAVRKQLAILAEVASKRGVAVGIGHPREATLDVLEEELPKLKARGFRFVRASSVVR